MFVFWLRFLICISISKETTQRMSNKITRQWVLYPIYVMERWSDSVMWIYNNQVSIFDRNDKWLHHDNGRAYTVNTLRCEYKGHHIADDIFKSIHLCYCISIQIAEMYYHGQLTISQKWLRQWLASHYLNLWCPSLLVHIWVNLRWWPNEGCSSWWRHDIETVGEISPLITVALSLYKLFNKWSSFRWYEPPLRSSVCVID